MKKIQRNDPCFCGSGIKYKKCHGLNGEIANSNVQKGFLNCDQVDLFKTIGALQLIPENHGKNIRFESLATEINNHAKNSNNHIGFENLKSFFSNNFLADELEDKPANCFTDNVLYFGGDYTVFPGINNYGARILNLYIEGIFTTKNSLSEEFHKKIHNGVQFILTISMLMASRARLSKYIYNYSPGNINLPLEKELQGLKDIVTFQDWQMKKLSNDHKFDFDIINEFVVDENDKDFNSHNPDKNPFLKRPLVKKGNEYIFVLPTAIVNCLIEFINKISREMGCKALLFDSFYNRKWHKIKSFCDTMGWALLPISLPTNANNIEIKEGVFKFDADKIAYVRLIENSNYNDGFIDDKDHSISNLYNNRTKEVLEFLKTSEVGVNDFFCLDIHGVNGSDPSVFLDLKADAEHIELDYFTLEILSLTDDINILSLWKFNRALKALQKQAVILPGSTLLDIYVHYMKNDYSFYNSDSVKPSHIMFAEIANEFIRETYIKRDEHCAPSYYKDSFASIPIRKLRDFSPIYIQIEDNQTHMIFVEGSHFLIWVKNFQAKQRSDKTVAHIIGEALLFWLYRLEEGLRKHLDPKVVRLLEFQTILDATFFSGEFVPENQTDQPILKTSIEDRVIKLFIPGTLNTLLLKNNNEGEKLLVKHALIGLNLFIKEIGQQELSDKIIDELIDTYMIPSNAKMILLFDPSNHVLNPKDLIPFRGIQEAEMEPLLDGLLDDLKIIDKTARIIEVKDEKKKLSNKIVSVYFEKVKQGLNEFNSTELLKFLMKMYEDCVRTRELRSIHIPAKIACFSDYPTEVEKLENDNWKLVNSSIAIRCLIEFIAAKPNFERKVPNYNDFDYIMACMNQLINWGMISDSIDLEISDPILEILPTERIGIQEKDSILPAFSRAKTESMLFDYQNSYAKERIKKKMDEQSLSDVREESANNNKELDDAFIDEYGISFTKIIELKASLMEIAFINELSVIEIEEDKLKDKLFTLKNNVLTIDEITNGLELLTLTSRDSIEKAPKGFDKTDVYPWKYNRAISYLRRPLVKIEKRDGKSYYYYGYRNISASIENLYSLIFKGRLKAKEGKLLSKFLAKINHDKGAEFRKEVYDWLVGENSSLRIIPYEVTIEENGHLIAEKNYGDIDILIIDIAKKIFYSVECKNTVGARVAHEMKTEMDKYLGRNGEEGMIQKHLDRDTWLKANIAKLSKFAENPEKYYIKSIVLTSEEIPILYLSKEKLPLPMLSFDKLCMNGVEFLNTI